MINSERAFSLPVAIANGKLSVKKISQSCTSSYWLDFWQKLLIFNGIYAKGLLDFSEGKITV
jgi:hypothetical protein